MKRFGTRPFLSRALLGTLALAAAGCSDEIAAPAAPGAAVRNEAADGLTPLDRHFVLFKNQNRVPADFAARVQALGGTLEDSFAAVGVATVTGLTPEAAARLAASDDVASLEQDMAFHPGFMRAEAEVDAAAMDEASAAGAVAANAAPLPDPTKAIYYRRQWNMRAIGADKAWAAGATGAGVRIAILDTGIDPTHPDVASLIDVSRSASFVSRDDTIAARWFPGQRLAPFTDMNGHGTHVASAASSRGLVTAGVASQATLMAVKVLGAVNGSQGSSVFRGLLYAVDNGADVVNMSLGGGFDRAGGGGIGAINRVINYAHRRGVTVVVAAGNSSADLQHNGSAYNTYCDAPNVICVSATGPVDGGRGGFLNDPNAYTGPFSDVDVPALFSNYGTNAINVAAPGGNYAVNAGGALTSIAYVWQACSKFGLNSRRLASGFEVVTGRNVCTANSRLHLPNGYVGTSQAAPHVAGLAALLVQKHGRNPALIRARIQQSADDVAGTGANPYYGKGRINVARALGL